ncbi:helix-turn-helix domain-containing protein [Gorillibacterium timonense]|uniref:helix-turn-helix domain-containing protein n=1 Tax=Gorillibacterium timonense TaxID=1689269 RepID=UPI00071E2BB7|nr:AraC family transcriptional regulator [Gorillibacterium timonense]
MEITKENIQYENPFLCMKIFEADRGISTLGNWHYHKEMEILFVVKGEFEIHTEEGFYHMTDGDILVIGSSQLHRDRVLTEESRYYVFQFDMQYYMEPSILPYHRFFLEEDFPFSRLNYIFQENAEAREIVQACVREIHHESQHKESGYEIAVSLLIKKILLTILRNDTRKLLNHPDSAEVLRLKPVLTYIEEHIEDKIHVEEASRIANISYYYFVKYFKKVLGMSFLEYVNFKKIKRAERYLLTKDMSIAEVGETIGMPNMAHFYKLFKKYNGCSPNEYRKKMLEWSR